MGIQKNNSCAFSSVSCHALQRNMLTVNTHTHTEQLKEKKNAFDLIQQLHQRFASNEDKTKF